MGGAGEAAAGGDWAGCAGAEAARKYVSARKYGSGSAGAAPTKASRHSRSCDYELLLSTVMSNLFYYMG